MNLVEKLHAKVEKGQLCLGTHCSISELEFFEICGMLGYDYVWIDAEHASVSFPQLKNAIIATNAGGACAIVRAPDHQMCNVKPILECGPDGVVFPMVNTAEQARLCVGHCLYPPKGTRGFGPLRANAYGMQPLEEYIAGSQRSILKLMQCEHVESVKNLDEILEVEGVDGIICGLMDLSASVGKLGKTYDPEVMDMVHTIMEKCKAHGKPFGLSLGMDMNMAKFWIQQGASFLSMGSPLDYFREMSKDIIGKSRAIEEGR